MPYSDSGLRAWKPRVDAACEREGRDPASLARTAGVLIDLPIAPGRAGWNAMSGSSEELAEGLRRYARRLHPRPDVQIWLEPSNLQGVETFAEVLALLNRG